MVVRSLLRWLAAATVVCVMAPASALEIKLDEKRDSLETVHNGQVVRVERIQNEDHSITGSFAKTSRKCPPFCIQPNSAAPGVETVSELEVFDFLEGPVLTGKGVLIDARLPSWYEKGTIPGSVNIPFTVFEAAPTDPTLVDALYKLGVRKRGEVNVVVRSLEKLGLLNGRLKNDDWDFTQAKEIVLWCNGPWCNQSPRAIHALLKLGYPAERIHYYRGGMQLWQLLGLTTIIP